MGFLAMHFYQLQVQRVRESVHDEEYRKERQSPAEECSKIRHGLGQQYHAQRKRVDSPVNRLVYYPARVLLLIMQQPVVLHARIYCNYVLL